MMDSIDPRKPYTYLRPLIQIRPLTENAEGVRTLSQIPHPLPEKDLPDSVLRYRFLKKGGAAMLISTSGVGKSTFSLQAAILWAMGQPMAGIRPARPLKIAIIQGEDDDDDIGEFRNDIVAELADGYGYSMFDLQEACDSVAFLDYTGKRGQTFVDKFKTDVEKGMYDLFIVNPLHSFFEGDLSQAKDCSLFFRLGIDPVIKPNKAAVLFVHHTGKPSVTHERRAWGQDLYSEYVGNGSAELTNWPRAVLVIVKHARAKGCFILSAPKRGQRIGWKDESGNPTTRKYIAYGLRGIFWREVSKAEVDAIAAKSGDAGGGRREKADERTARCLKELKEALADGPLKASDLKGKFKKPSDAKFIQKFIVADEPSKCGVWWIKARKNNAIFFALDEESAKEAAERYSVSPKLSENQKPSGSES